ncbi:MAG: hypothetical protein PVG39_17610 [Desulfobacteraceae bacterium]|jgi:hypothetical protein
MKKTKVFFMAMIIAINLLGFSGTSLAFDMSKITSKPVEFAKYIAKKLGFGDSDEEKPRETKPAQELAVKESTVSTFAPDSNTVFFNYNVNDLNKSVFADGFSSNYELQEYNEEINYYYSNEDWYFRIDSRTGELFTPFAYGSSYVPVWQTKVEYLTDLSRGYFSQLSTELFLESSFSRQQTQGSDGSYPDSINKTYGFEPDNMEYGLSINALVKDAKISLYGWHGNDVSPFGSASLLDIQGASSDPLWRYFNSDYYQGNNNLAAAISYELPFMNFFHQGMSPKVRLETAYRFGANNPENGSLIENRDQWKVGMAYEGSNRIDWLNNYGINWGVGYNYTVTLDDMDALDSLRQSYSSHSGNINANTYWFNMKLYTMFMYLYDRQTRGSMTVLNATYSPDWRWSYGIKANFYYGDKDGDSKEFKEKSEVVSLTATYRWD